MDAGGTTLQRDIEDRILKIQNATKESRGQMPQRNTGDRIRSLQGNMVDRML
jgi:hypothetical protein